MVRARRSWSEALRHKREIPVSHRGLRQRRMAPRASSAWPHAMGMYQRSVGLGCSMVAGRLMARLKFGTNVAPHGLHRVRTRVREAAPAEFAVENVPRFGIFDLEGTRPPSRRPADLQPRNVALQKVFDFHKTRVVTSTSAVRDPYVAALTTLTRAHGSTNSSQMKSIGEVALRKRVRHIHGAESGNTIANGDANFPNCAEPASGFPSEVFLNAVSAGVLVAAIRQRGKPSWPDPLGKRRKLREPDTDHVVGRSARIASMTASSFAWSLCKYPCPPSLLWYFFEVLAFSTSNAPLTDGVGSPPTTMPGILSSIAFLTRSKRERYPHPPQYMIQIVESSFFAVLLCEPPISYVVQRTLSACGDGR
jgi:hypothetical protein